MGLATAESILGSVDFDTKDIELRHWGTVRIRMLTAPERLGFVKRFGKEVEGEAAMQITLDVVVTAAINEDGSPLFTAEQLERLKHKNWDNISTLAREALAFNGVSEEVVKEAEKNLPSARNGASPSASASPSAPSTQTASA